MLLIFAFSNAHAQKGWVLQSTNATEIVGDDAHYYALQRGFTSKKVENGFLNSGTTKIVPQFDNSCVFRFVPVGEKDTGEEVLKIYVLQNILNNQYICTTSTKYTSAISEAFRFTARKAVEITPTNKQDWNVYSHSVLSPDCAGAEEAGTWVFCNPDKFQFLSFEQNHNPGFNVGYIVCTNWFVFEVKPKELTPLEKYEAVYDEHIAKHPLTAELYPIGTDPGCISQAMYDKMAAVYAETGEATAHSDMSKEDCEKYINMILTMVEEYNKSIVQVKEGKYYIIQNAEMGFAKDNGRPYCDGVSTYPTEWNVENANYIWLADSTSAEGGIFYQNVSTGRYLGKRL